MKENQSRGALFVGLITFSGAALGAALAITVYGLFLLFRNPGTPPGVVMSHLTATPWLIAPNQWIPFAGAAVGFLAFGAMIGSRFSRATLRGVLTGLKLFFGILIGGAFGLIGYTILWLATNPDQPTSSALDQPLQAVHGANEPVRAFLIAGALAGFVVAMYAVGGQSMRRWSRAVAGLIVGGLAGLVIFAVGFVVVNYPVIPDSSEYVYHFAEAIYSFTAVEFLFISLGSSVGLLMSNYSWRLYGVLTLIALVSVVLGYIAYTVTQTLPYVPASTRPLSYVLFVVETMSLLMVLLYSFYSIDVATRKHWRRTPRDAQFSPFYMPKIAFQVPMYNEPPEVALGTLRTLVNIDYPVDRYVIMVLDDSTNPESSEPVKEFVQQHKKDCQISYIHRTDRRGYKAGALNNALKFTPDDANLIAVVDADYQVEPEYLRETVGFFVDAELGWLQTPQDYRNRNQSFLTEQYYMADAYFYRAVLPSRNEENSIIFCGTMGILRKQALLDVGGWGERYITEDAELSLRLVNSGWKSLYVNKTFGRGLIPATFEGYKSQHYRWAFGGGKILRGHILDFLFGKFTPRQRFDYFVGNINWFEGIFIFIISLAVLSMGIGELMGIPFVTHHTSEILLIGLVPFFLLIDGLTRVHMVLRRTMSMTFGATLRVVGMWFSVKFSDMIGAFKALFGMNIPFLRTPKAPSDRLTGFPAVKHAVRLTRFECSMATLLFATAVGISVKMWTVEESTSALTFARLLLIFWLIWYTLVFLCAPVYAYQSYATLSPSREKLAAPIAVQGVPS